MEIMVSAEVFDRLILELSEPGRAVPALAAAFAKRGRLVLYGESNG